MIYQKIRMRSFYLVFVGEQILLEYLGKGSEIWLCTVNVSDFVLVLSMYSIQVFYSNKQYVN